MIVREYTDADYDAIRKLHLKSGFDYNLPSLSSSEFFSRRIISDNSGIGMGAFLKLNAEVYLICNPRWRNPAWRNEALRKLHIICNDDAKDKEVQEIVAWIPPQIANTFGRRLKKLDWDKCRDGWQCVYHEVL